MRTLDALAGLGSAGVPPLLGVLTNQPSARTYIVSLLGRMRTDALAAVPALLNLLASPDHDLRDDVTNALRKIDPSVLERAGQ
jgi:HEAT repeat protein